VALTGNRFSLRYFARPGVAPSAPDRLTQSVSLRDYANAPLNPASGLTRKANFPTNKQRSLIVYIDQAIYYPVHAIQSA
jgi:hypothetical protein